jgi:hypothetical protein
LVSAYTPKPHLQSHLILLVLSDDRSLDQPFVSESLPAGFARQAVKPSQGVVRNVSFIEPERIFVDVAVKMLGAHVMEGAVKRHA